jgi:tetratricopeptide (TPR) repeat protein
VRLHVKVAIPKLASFRCSWFAEFKAQFKNADIDKFEMMSDLVHKLPTGRDRDEATALAVRLLASQQIVLGEDNPTSLATADMLAHDLHSKGQYREAAKLRRRILQQRQKGPTMEDFPTLAKAFTTYGQSLFKLEDYAEAKDALVGGIRLYTTANGNGDLDLDIFDCAENLANTIFAQGLHNEAIALGSKILRDRRRLLGHSHADTISSMSDVATYLCNVKWAQKSREMIVNAMGMFAKHLGMEHSTTISTWSNAATIFRQLGDWETARPLACRSFAMSQQSNGQHHPDTLSTMSEVSRVLQHDHEFSDASKYMARCIRYTAHYYGWDHPLTLRRSGQLHGFLSEAAVHGTRKRPNLIGALFKASLRQCREQRLPLVQHEGFSEEEQKLYLGKTLFYV